MSSVDSGKQNGGGKHGGAATMSDAPMLDAPAPRESARSGNAARNPDADAADALASADMWFPMQAPDGFRHDANGAVDASADDLMCTKQPAEASGSNLAAGASNADPSFRAFVRDTWGRWLAPGAAADVADGSTGPSSVARRSGSRDAAPASDTCSRPLQPCAFGDSAQLRDSDQSAPNAADRVRELATEQQAHIHRDEHGTAPRPDARAERILSRLQGRAAAAANTGAHTRSEQRQESADSAHGDAAGQAAAEERRDEGERRNSMRIVRARLLGRGQSGEEAVAAALHPDIMAQLRPAAASREGDAHTRDVAYTMQQAARPAARMEEHAWHVGSADSGERQPLLHREGGHQDASYNAGANGGEATAQQLSGSTSAPAAGAVELAAVTEPAHGGAWLLHADELPAPASPVVAQPAAAPSPAASGSSHGGADAADPAARFRRSSSATERGHAGADTDSEEYLGDAFEEDDPPWLAVGDPTELLRDEHDLCSFLYGQARARVQRCCLQFAVSTWLQLQSCMHHDPFQG